MGWCWPPGAYPNSVATRLRSKSPHNPTLRIWSYDVGSRITEFPMSHTRDTSVVHFPRDSLGVCGPITHIIEAFCRASISHIYIYICSRSGLHNVFTSLVPPQLSKRPADRHPLRGNSSPVSLDHGDHMRLSIRRLCHIGQNEVRLLPGPGIFSSHKSQESSKKWIRLLFGRGEVDRGNRNPRQSRRKVHFGVLRPGQLSRLHIGPWTGDTSKLAQNNKQQSIGEIRTHGILGTRISVS